MLVSRKKYRKQCADLESMIAKCKSLEQEIDRLRAKISELEENADCLATEEDVAQKLRTAICKGVDKMTGGSMYWFGSGCTSADVMALVAAYIAFDRQTCETMPNERLVSK